MKYAAVLFDFALAACGRNEPPPPPAATGSSSQSGAAGGSSCSANSVGGKGCNITCQSGEVALCRDGSGGADATCTCTK